jgi:dipeptide/tripeptide permease
MERIKNKMKAFIYIFILGILILIIGGVTFWLIKDQKGASWNFGNKKIVPGESPYSTERVK